MKKFIALLMVATCVGTVSADVESHKATAEKLLALVAPKEMFVESFNSAFGQQVAQFRQMGIGQEQIEQILAASGEFVQKVVADPDLQNEMVKLYQEAYTEAEMNELLDFYATPIGKKTLEVMPMLTQKGANIGQNIAMKYQPDFQTKIQTILMAGMAAQGGMGAPAAGN